MFFRACPNAGIWSLRLAFLQRTGRQFARLVPVAQPGWLKKQVFERQRQAIATIGVHAYI